MGKEGWEGGDRPVKQKGCAGGKAFGWTAYKALPALQQFSMRDWEGLRPERVSVRRRVGHEECGYCPWEGAP